jgi:integrase
MTKARGKPRGRHPIHRLTALAIRRAGVGRHADGNGLYLVVDPSGAKRWVLRIVVHGRRRDLGLGSLQLVSLADAREHARALRRLARQGGDPVAERARARRVVPTFREAAVIVHAAHTAPLRNAKHRAIWLASLERHVFPAFGDRRVDQVGTAEILQALAPIWTRKPETARRVRQRIRAVLDWAKASGHRTGDNPADAIARVLPAHRRSARHLAALAYERVPTFLAEVRAAEAAAVVRWALELVILTATRTSEVLGARWEEVDLDAGVWTIPASRIKVGREHRIPLVPAVAAVFRQAAKVRGDQPYVFPGRRPGRPLSNMALLMLVRRLQYDITVHGFRSSFRDWAAECTRTPREVCEQALAHALPSQVEAAYRRSDLFERRRKLMQAWARFVMTPARAGKVLAFGRRA